MNVIEFKQFSLAFGHRYIFQDFTASIKAGEFIAILGANGAGKSSLLRSILGLIPAAQGAISVFGRAAHKGADFIGYMPQMRQNISNSLSAYAWLGANLNGYQWGLPFLNAKQTKELQRVIQMVNAERIINQPYNLLSGGERQRLFLAQALLNKPKILLLDEPLMNLDPYFQATLVNLIDTIRVQYGITILFTSHDINPLISSVDRVLYLAKGKAVMGLVNDIINSKKLSELYGMDIQVIQHEQQLFVINKELGFHHHVNHCRPDLDHFSV